MKKLYYKARQHIDHPRATLLFFGLVFIEAFLFMPVNTLLTLYGVERSQKVYTYALLAVIASVLGGLLAYGVGFLLDYYALERWLYWLISPDKFEQLQGLIRAHSHWAVFVGSLLPIPYKVITLGSGWSHVSLRVFIFGIIAGRCVRFFVLATALRLFGKRVQEIIDRYFTYIVLLTLVTLLLTAWFFH